MKISRKTVQLTLISIGLLLIISTYFLYPKINQNKFYNEKISKEEQVKTKTDESNIFENVEYNGLYGSDKPFIVQSEKASILKKEPDIVYMTKMKVILDMKDGKVIIITSSAGRYNKKTYDCFFVGNVKAADGETIILSENLDLLATQDTAIAYNEVILTSKQGSLKADKIDYDFETKFYHVTMFDNDKVKIKLVE